ncbi:MAG TPA: acylphosphatase [Thermoplasmata archaeon]|nr:acylphosphatase [Thermoplasmata archaeon]
MHAQARVVFHGLVQGVTFRANCRRDAIRRGLTGWVRNRADGSVEATFEGERADVEAAIEWNQTSQPHAQVIRADVAWADPTGEFHVFQIRR